MKKITVENVIDIINANIKSVEITLDQCDDDLSEMGMDSITFIQIVVLLEDKFGCEIPDSKLLISEMNTINKIYSVLMSVVKDS